MSTERENITFKNGGFLFLLLPLGCLTVFFSLHLSSAVVTNDIIINVFFSLELIIICISFCWIIIVILTFLLS